MDFECISPVNSPSDLKASPANPIHSFFTPRRRPFSAVTANDSPLTKGQLAADDAPSQNKRQRATGCFGGVRTPVRDTDEEAGPGNPPRQVVSRWPTRNIRPQQATRRFLREIGALSGPRQAHRRGFHCLHWSIELLKFCSRPRDSYYLLSPESDLSLPFSVQALNRNPLVAVGDETGAIRLLESDKDQAPGFETDFVRLPSHDNAIFDISISKDDVLMATACGDQKIRVMDITKQTILHVLDGHVSSVKQVAFEPTSSSIIASCSRDGTAMIWDLRANIQTRFDNTEFITHRPVEVVRGAHASLTAPKGRASKSIVSVTALAWAIPNTFLTACESRAELRCWDRRSIKQDRRGNSQPCDVSAEPKHHQVRPFGINSISISPDKSMAYTLCKDSIVYAWGTRLLEHGPLHAYHHPELHASSFYVKSDISPDGQYLATGSSSGSACIFPTAQQYFDKRLYAQKTDFPEGSRIQAVSKNIPVGTGVVLVRAHNREVTDVSWTNKGDLVTISDDYHARCWRSDDKGVNARDMRENGEENGRRWGWGWAQLQGEKKEGQDEESSDESSVPPVDDPTDELDSQEGEDGTADHCSQEQ